MTRRERTARRLAAAREVFFTAPDPRRRENAFAMILKIVENRLETARRSGAMNRRWSTFREQEGLMAMPAIPPYQRLTAE